MADAPELKQLAAKAAELQQAFFSEPNSLRFEPLGSSAVGGPVAALSESLRRHRQGHADQPVLLPFKARDAKRVVWYACAQTEAMGRALESELASFLGPSFIEFSSPVRPQDAADIHALSLLAGWRVLRFEALNARAEEMVAKQWQTYCRLLSRRPKAATYVVRCFEQVRAAFDRALLARNEADANAAMASMRERFGLSAENRLYLEIRLAAAFERWDQVAGHRLLPTIVHLNLPPETYGDVVEALYEQNVRPYEEAPRIDDLLAEFKDSFLEVARPLLRTRRTSRRGAVLKAFLLHELTQDSPKADACAALLQGLLPGSFGSLDAAIRQRVAALHPVDSYGPAEQALEREEFDRAYDLLWPLNDEVRVLRGLVLCARESEDPVKAQAVLDRLAAAPAPSRQAVEAASPGRLEKLRRVALVNLSRASLSAQLDRVNGESLDSYVERWRELARSVPPSQVLDEPGLAAAAAECVMRQALQEPELFERTYPLWYELFVERVDPDSRLLLVYEALLETTRLRPLSDSELQLLHQIVIALVYAGADKAQYVRAVDEVLAVFMELRSPYIVTWALDVCDALAIAPTRDSDARLRLLSSVVQACSDYQSRLTPLQFGMLRMLCAEAGIELPALLLAGSENDDSQEVAQHPHSEGSRLVALYSLDEPSTRRAMHLLKQLDPQLRIELNADHVCTPRLKALAHSADVFVFAWKSSKHAAFDCVKAAVKTKDHLVMARGAGTTSLVAAAMERVQGGSGALT